MKIHLDESTKSLTTELTGEFTISSWKKINDPDNFFNVYETSWIPQPEESDRLFKYLADAGYNKIGETDKTADFSNDETDIHIKINDGVYTIRVKESIADDTVVKELNKCKTIDDVDDFIKDFDEYRVVKSEHEIGRDKLQTTVFVYKDDAQIWQNTFTEELNKTGGNMLTKLHLEESINELRYYKDIEFIMDQVSKDSPESILTAKKELNKLRVSLHNDGKRERKETSQLLSTIDKAIDNAWRELGESKNVGGAGVKESVMTPTPTPYKADFTSAQVEPLVVFALFGEKNKPLLSNRGVVITSKIGEDFEQTYANSLYRLVKNLKDVYVIDNEVYDKTKDFRTDEEFYDFVKKNGKKLEFTDKDFIEPTQDNSIVDDTDFLIKMIDN